MTDNPEHDALIVMLGFEADAQRSEGDDFLAKALDEAAAALTTLATENTKMVEELARALAKDVLRITSRTWRESEIIGCFMDRITALSQPTADDTALVERLERLFPDHETGQWELVNPDGPKAAARITELSRPVPSEASEDQRWLIANAFIAGAEAVNAEMLAGGVPELDPSFTEAALDYVDALPTAGNARPVPSEPIVDAARALISNLNGYAARLAPDTIDRVRDLWNAIIAAKENSYDHRPTA